MATRSQNVMLPKLGAVPKHLVKEEGLQMLERMCSGIVIIDKRACWDHMLMFNLRDELCRLYEIERRG